MFNFNDSQRQALDLRHHIVLTAAAGSGKTSVLVERFVRILEANGFLPRQVVALTFTEEAAREMRERVVRLVEQRASTYAGAGPNPWQAVLRRLSQASITTIHGFCLQILRTHFDRLGLDPETRLLSPSEQPVLLEESIRDFLDEASRSRDPDLARLLDFLSLSSIQRCLSELVGRRNAFRELVSDEAAHQELARVYQREACHWILDSPEWRQLADTLKALPPVLLRAPGTMSQRCRDQFHWVVDRESVPDLRRVMAVADTLKQRFSPSQLWKESSWRDPVKLAWDGLRAILAKHPLHFEPAAPRQDALFQTAIETLARIYQRVLDEFSRVKARLRVVDFEDLLDLARRLLQSPDVRRSLQRRYPFLLVDEFQDTNQVQWEILQSMLGPDSNFMAVGDDKQSIYRFRQADVAVFRKVRKWISRFGRGVEMPENYRSAPELVDFNNRIFRQLFSGGLDYEAIHQEMVAARADGNSGKVEAFFYEPEDRVPEAVRVASWIEHLIESGRTASEIAILLRTRNRLKDYEEALASRGIDFTTVAGAGFFESQEVLDAIALLRWLIDEDDDIALAGVLRSPFFNLSDEQLIGLSGLPGGSLIRKLLDQGEPPAGGQPEIRFARWVLLRLRESARLGEASSQLLRQAYRLTGYETILEHSSRSRVSLGNLRKLLRLLTDFEGNRSRSRRQLLRFLDGVLSSSGNEPEAETRIERDEGVRIYTIHGAKGLEFPVVVLPELGYPFSAAPNDPLYVFAAPDQLGERALPGLLLWDPEENYQDLEHPRYRILQKLDGYRQLAEEKRLLYVAMTRCQEHLILLGSRGTAESCAGWLRDCGAEDFQVEHSFVVEPREVEDLLQLQVSPPAEGPSMEEEMEAQAPLPSRSRRLWSPTQISAWRNCARRFFLAEIEGVPEEDDPGFDPPRSEEVLVGTAVHEVLERIPQLDSEVALTQAVEQISNRLLSSRDSSPADFRRRVLGHLERIRQVPLFDRLRNARRSFSEREFRWNLAGRQVHGVIDRLFQESLGNWVVVDFKTSHPMGKNDAGNSQNQDQLAIYLAAVHSILEPQRLEGLLFFSAASHVQRVLWEPALQEQVEGWIRRLPSSQEEASYPRTTRPERCRACPYLANGHCSGAAAVQQTLW